MKRFRTLYQKHTRITHKAQHACFQHTKQIPYATQQCFRAGDRASGPDFSRILIRKASKSALRPKAGRRADLDVFPTRIRPRSGPEAQYPARKYYCVTESTYNTTQANPLISTLNNFEHLGAVPYAERMVRKSYKSVVHHAHKYMHHAAQALGTHGTKL